VGGGGRGRAGGGSTGSCQCWSVGQPVHSSLLPTMAFIASDEDVFAQFKQETWKQYVRMWSQFCDFIPDFDFESGPPGEEAFTNFVKFLRLEKNLASTSLWTYYWDFVMEEDAEMCAAAGIPVSGPSTVPTP
jgi:hypothetical protein